MTYQKPRRIMLSMCLIFKSSPTYTYSVFSALEHLPCVVNDLVQGLAKRFGMVTSILMCGPIPTKGGMIDVVRYVMIFTAFLGRPS